MVIHPGCTKPFRLTINYDSNNKLFYYTNNEVVGGYIGFSPSVCPSVCPSVRLSRLPCPLCNIYSSGWILSILATNDHYYERVCRTQWPLTLTYIFKVIWPWLRVRSVASTVLDGFFLYLAQMITIISGCVACKVVIRIWNFSALTLKKKIYSSRWILSIFSTNDH